MLAGRQESNFCLEGIYLDFVLLSYFSYVLIILLLDQANSSIPSLLYMIFYTYFIFTSIVT